MGSGYPSAMKSQYHNRKVKIVKERRFGKIKTLESKDSPTVSVDLDGDGIDDVSIQMPASWFNRIKTAVAACITAFVLYCTGK